MPALSPELLAILGIIGVHLIPKILMRARIPAPVTALLLGLVVSRIAPALANDPTILLLSTLGIASLFLFAGLEVEPDKLGERPTLLLAGLLGHALLLGGAALFGVFGLSLEVVPAMLLALGVATPSGGFILDGLSGLGADEHERHAIRDGALIAELLSLVVFFFVTQSSSIRALLGGSIAIGLLLFLVPILLRGLSRAILPYAPNAEFALLVLVAVVCAYTTRRLGIYYLLGAFAVGVIARQLQHEVPELASERNLQAVELFAAFFAPFYFAHAGMLVDPTTISLRALGFAAVLMLFAVPLRIGTVAAIRYVSAGEPLRDATRVGGALIPTFVFSLVMAQMLLATSAPKWIAGGLVLFAVGNAFVPKPILARVAATPPVPKSPSPTKSESAADATSTAAPSAEPPVGSAADARPESNGSETSSRAAPHDATD